MKKAMLPKYAYLFTILALKQAQLHVSLSRWQYVFNARLCLYVLFSMVHKHDELTNGLYVKRIKNRTFVVI